MRSNGNSFDSYFFPFYFEIYLVIIAKYFCRLPVGVLKARNQTVLQIELHRFMNYLTWLPVIGKNWIPCSGNSL